MHLLHYIDEIRPVYEISELNGIQRANVDIRELSLGKLLVENLSSEHFDVSQYSDARQTSGESKRGYQRPRCSAKG